MGWTWEKAKGYLRKRGDKDSGAEVTVNPCVGSGEVGIELQRISVPLLDIRCKTRVCVVVHTSNTQVCHSYVWKCSYHCWKHEFRISYCVCVVFLPFLEFP